MTGPHETDGFLQPKIAEDIARLHAQFPELFSLLLRCNKLAMAIRSRLISKADDRQKLLESTLYARALQSLQAAVLLAERGMVADARTAVRSASETTIYLVKMSREAGFSKNFLENFAYNERKTSKAILDDATLASTLSVEQKKSLENLITWADSEYPHARQARFNVADVAASVGLQSFYTSTFRRMSGDGAHTSIVALSRHPLEAKQGHLHVHFGPQLDGLEDTLHAIVMVFMFMIRTAQKSWRLKEWDAQIDSLSKEWDALLQ